MGRQEIACAWDLDKKSWCSHDLPFCVAIWCVVVDRWSHHTSLTKAKSVLKKAKIGSSNDAWKGYLKTWNQWNSQSFQGNCLWTLQEGFTAPHVNNQLQGASAPMTIKLNPSWKTEVSKSAWINPCISVFKFQYYTMLKVDITEEWDVVYSSPPPPIYTGYTETLAAWSV